jgi:hypothetical protein
MVQPLSAGKLCQPRLAAAALLSLQPVADSLLKPIEDSYPGAASSR